MAAFTKQANVPEIELLEFIFDWESWLIPFLDPKLERFACKEPKEARMSNERPRARAVMRALCVSRRMRA